MKDLLAMIERVLDWDKKHKSEESTFGRVALISKMAVEAPRLAKALRIAVEALEHIGTVGANFTERTDTTADEALEKIAAIAEEGK